MGTKVEALAAEIATLDEADREALFERLSVQSYRQGLVELSERYRKRL